MINFHDLITSGAIAWSLLLIAGAVWFYISFRDTEEHHHKSK